jgi:hypothetical protein
MYCKEGKEICEYFLSFGPADLTEQSVECVASSASNLFGASGELSPAFWYGLARPKELSYGDPTSCTKVDSFSLLFCACLSSVDGLD